MAAKPIFVDEPWNSQPRNTSVANKSVVVKNLSPSTSKEAIIIYFQRRKNGGGEVDGVCLRSEGVAVVTFEKEEVAESVLTRAHNIDGVKVKVERIIQTSNQVFDKVAARLDPESLGLSFSSLEEILQSIKDKTGVEWRGIFDGFVVSGTFEQIEKVHNSLQKIKSIRSYQGKKETAQTDCKRSAYPMAFGQSPRTGKLFTEPAIGRKHSNIDRNSTGKANMRESQGRGSNHPMNIVNSKMKNKGEDKLVQLQAFTHGSVVPSFDFPGAESTPSIEQKRESEKNSIGRDQCQAKGLKTDHLMATADRKMKTDEARKLEDELKKSPILGVGERRLNREEASKFSDHGSPQIMPQNYKGPTELSASRKHKVENTFLDGKTIVTRSETPIQKVTNKEICGTGQGTTTESCAIKKSCVEDDPNERKEDTEPVTDRASNDVSGTTSEPAPYTNGAETRGNHQNQDETEPFETLSRKQQGGNNNGLWDVREKGNSLLGNGGEAVISDHIEENDIIETPQRNEICEKQVHPQSKGPNGPSESIKEPESTIATRESNHIKFLTETGITVLLLKGDITNHHVDLLIRPANPSLCYKEGPSNQIQEIEDTLVKNKCQRITQGQETPKYGEAFFTDGGNLPCKAVLHVILPLWIEEKKDTKELKHLIHMCLKKGLILASEHGHKSVALPPLGQGGNPIPVRFSAEVTTRIIATFSRSVSPLHNGVTDFHIVCKDDATFSIFAKKLREFSFRDKQQPYFAQAEDKTVPYESISRCGTGLKKDELSSLKGTPCLENQNATMLPVSKSDLTSQPASFFHGTESRKNRLTQNEAKPREALPKSRQDNANDRLKNVKEKENAFLENGGEAVTNHPKGEKSLIEAPKQGEIYGEETYQHSKSPNSEESIEDAESLTTVMRNNHMKFSTETGITVMLFKGNVTSHNADVLISPANPSLCYKVGLSKQIQEAGGSYVKDECLMLTQGQKMLKYGEVLVTGSGNLPCKAVFHAILPPWTDGEEDKKKLKRQIHNCLKDGLMLASGHRHRSVAFPLLGQEWNPIPVHVSAEVITRVIADYSKDVGPLHSGVTNAHVVCEDEASFELFAKELEEFSFPHKQQKHFKTRNKLYEDYKAVANESTRISGCIKDKSSAPEEKSRQSAAFSISFKTDPVPEEENGTTQMVSPREEIVTSSIEIKSSEELSAVGEKMTMIEVDDLLQPEEARAFEILEATSGRHLLKRVGEVSKSVPEGESLNREIAEEFKRDEFEEQVTVNHDFENKSSVQLQQCTAVDPFSTQEAMEQHHAQRSIRHITNLPPLSMGMDKIIRRSSNSSSLHDGGRLLEGFMSPTIESLINADLHLGAQGLKLLHDDDDDVKKKEDLEESSSLNSHEKNSSTASSVPHLIGLQSNDNMPHNSRRKVEKILDSNMELETPDILETTIQNSPSLRTIDDENGLQTLPEKNVSAETAQPRNARTLCALCQEAVDQLAIENSNTCEKHKFCDDCTQKAFSFSDDCPACADAYGLINPKRVDIVTLKRRSNLDTKDTHPSTSDSISPVERPSIAHRSVGPQGNQPPGEMMWKKYSEDLTGFEGYGTIVTTFTFYDGVQSPEHPTPGKPYKGISCMAYFPNSQEGKGVLKLLRKAFDARLVFTISQTAAEESGQVVLDGLELKTTAESYLRNGQPDVDYFSRLKGQLAAKGIC